MNSALSANTQAILLLVAPLIVRGGEASADLLSLGEYNRLARVLRENQRQPADLLGTDRSELFQMCQRVASGTRLERLLARGFLLSQVVEQWRARAIWVVSRADSTYPKRLKGTPVFDRLWSEYPHTTLKASGEAVGLPEGQMGNSEVGHLTIGSGRILFQDLQRVNVAVRDGSLFENQVLIGAFERARERGGEVHLLGLVSHGGVHSHIEHLKALLELAGRQGMAERTWIHAFTDGRDVSPTSAVSDLAELPAERIATVVGRYYAMDRDKRWERTQKALDAILGGMCTHASPSQLVTEVQRSYDTGVTDEFLEPICVEGAPRLRAGDAVIFFNFRPDRGRQLAGKLVEAGFDVTTMTSYSSELDVPVAFAEQQVLWTLAESLAAAGARQLHVAETEKYAHVTYFFNGGVEAEWPGETRILVPSPRDVPSYDHKPEMSARELAARFAAEIGNDYRFAVINFANPGHGRPHGLDPGRHDRCRGRGRVSRRRRRSDPCGRRRLPHHGRPRQRGDDARSGRCQPAYRPHDEPGPARAHITRFRAQGRRRTLRSSSYGPAAPGFGPTVRDDGRQLVFSVQNRTFLLTFRRYTPAHLSLPQPDLGVLRKAQRGDERAFSLIVRAYELPVFNYVLRLVGDRSLAEDLTQEVFLRVYQGLPSFSLRCRFTTWLFQVTKNRVLDELRALERRPRAVVNLDDIPPLEVVDAPFERIEAIDAVWRAVEALSVDLKMALLLRDVVGLSYTEIADSLEVTLATVKWRIYKAREDVQVALAREGITFATTGEQPAERALV